jgi:hypothetical protein
MRFEGIIPAVTTPFDRAGDVDAAALESNVRAYVEAGVHGLVATGTMGEAGEPVGRGAPRRGGCGRARRPGASR